MSQAQAEPIRILHVVTNMSYGGLENLLMNYYRNIDRTKIQFDFMTHFQGHQDFEEEIQELGGRLFRLPRLNPFDPRYLAKLNRFFADHPEFKIVHSHLDCMAGLPLKYAQRNGVPVRIAHSHNSNQGHNLKYIVKLLYREIIPVYATNLFACGRDAGDWMFKGKKYTIMTNAIRTQEFAWENARRNLIRAKFDLTGKFVVGHVGQFREQKNHLYLLEIFTATLSKNPNARLVLVGKGPEMERCIEKADELGIREQVLFLGARADIPDLMLAMDVFVLPSLYEGFPVTMVEAQASGLPCIISDSVPLECKITNDVTPLSLRESPQVWAEEILKYDNFVRRNNCDVIVAAGYDINTNIRWLEEFYQNAIKRS